MSGARKPRAFAKPGGLIVLTTQSGNIYKTEQFLGHLRHYKREGLAARLERPRDKDPEVLSWRMAWLNLQKIAAHTSIDGAENIVQATSPARRYESCSSFSIIVQIRFALSRPQIVIVASKLP